MDEIIDRFDQIW